MATPPCSHDERHQGAGQAADKTLTLGIPPAVSPNLTNALALENSGQSVGTAIAVSPLVPGTLTGNVTLTSPVNNPSRGR